MDKIILKDINIYAFHGAMKEEKSLGQNFIIDLELYLDLKPAGESDDLTKTVNYAEVYNVVKHITLEKSYDLIETLAEKIAEEILEFTLVKNVKVMVKKPSVPINGNLAYAAVEIYR